MGADKPLKTHFLFKSELILMQKEGDSILKNTNEQGTLSYPSLLLLLHSISKTLTVKVMMPINQKYRVFVKCMYTKT